MIKLPEKFTETMQTLLGDEYDAFIESYNRPVYSGVRVNTLKLAPQDYLALIGETLEAVPWNENGFYCESAKSIREIRCIMRDFIIYRSRVQCFRQDCCRLRRATGYLICVRRPAEKVRRWRQSFREQGFW